MSLKNDGGRTSLLEGSLDFRVLHYISNFNQLLTDSVLLPVILSNWGLSAESGPSTSASEPLGYCCLG